MTHSLPTDPPSARSLTAVWPNLLAAVEGRADGWWAPARSVVLVAVDGMGVANIAARAGHARFLSLRSTKKAQARTVFPSTTAAALASLMTAEPPGANGIVGYRARVPGAIRAANQLTGWDDGSLPPDWLNGPTVFERESALGRPCFAVGPPEHAASGFTRAVLAGAEYHRAASADEAVRIAADLAAAHAGALVYVYIPTLDRLGHKLGSASDEWSTALEDVDSAIAELDRLLSSTTGAVVTADHGMLDVPRHRHVLLSAGDALLDGVAEIGGEPRMLHLYAEPDASVDGLAAAWRGQEEHRSWVMTRAEAIAAGLFGPVTDGVRPRIGDVLVAARAGLAYYDDRLADKRAQGMVGQHGSLTPAERIVPLIPLGAFG